MHILTLANQNDVISSNLIDKSLSYHLSSLDVGPEESHIGFDLYLRCWVFVVFLWSRSLNPLPSSGQYLQKHVHSLKSLLKSRMHIWELFVLSSILFLFCFWLRLSGAWLELSPFAFVQSWQKMHVWMRETRLKLGRRSSRNEKLMRIIASSSLRSMGSTHK